MMEKKLALVLRINSQIDEDPCIEFYDKFLYLSQVREKENGEVKIIRSFLPGGQLRLKNQNKEVNK